MDKSMVFYSGLIIMVSAVLSATLVVKFGLENRIKTKLGKWGLSPYRQTIILGFLGSVIVLILFIYPITFIMHNLIGLIGFWVGISYPLVLMFFRPKIFDEKLKMTFPRHLIYYAFSLAAGAFMTIRGFSMLNFSDIPAELGVTVIILGLIGQTIPLFPDYIEKISPVKLGINKGSGHLNVDERKKAGIFMAVLSVVIFLIIRFVAMIIQSQIFGIPT